MVVFDRATVASSSDEEEESSAGRGLEREVDDELSIAPRPPRPETAPRPPRPPRPLFSISVDLFLPIVVLSLICLLLTP